MWPRYRVGQWRVVDAMGGSPYDVVVVGGGAAGLSAALVLGRARRRVAVVDAGSPRNAPAEHMQRFLSRDGMPPTELLARGRAEVGTYGVDLIDGRVEAFEPGYVVRLVGSRNLLARRILLATGVRDVLPDIPGVRERWEETCCTARTATGGRSATGRSGSWGRARTPSGTHCWCGNGPPMSSSSRIR